MSSSIPKLPRWVGSAAFVAVLLTLALVFQRELRAWFGASPSSGGRGESSAARSPNHASEPSSAAGSTSPSEIDHYTCSMHPAVKQSMPGKCPICGMDLLAVTKEQQLQGVVTIDEARRQLIGVRTAPVVEGPFQRSFRALGRISYDESAITDVNLKVRGWITKLFVNQTGQRVTRGQPLFLLYSPDLFSAEQDFLLANQGATGTGGGASPSRMEQLGRAARQRLRLLGLSDAQVDEVARKGVPSESIALASPASGFVIEKNVVDGASVEAGMRLYRIASLNKVWVEAEVYEADLAQVRTGQVATVTLDYLPGRAYEAKIAYVYPYLDPTSRTGRVRLELANKQLELRPGMFASVTLSADAVSRVQVPAAAIVYTGPRRLVFVDLGEGRFRPQEVKVGSEGRGMYEVLSGLAPGDRVATSGVFLLAAEARISTAAKYWDKAPESAPDPTLAPSSAAGAASAPTWPTPLAPKPGEGLPPAKSPGAKSGGVTAPASPAVIYRCPMHPEVQSSVPGKCSKCGMNLEPVPGAQ